jgi:hypothetical protein
MENNLMSAAGMALSSYKGIFAERKNRFQRKVINIQEDLKVDDNLKKDIIELGNDIIRETILLLRSMERNSCCMKKDEKRNFQSYLFYNSLHPDKFCIESVMKFTILDCIHNIPELLTSIENEKWNYFIENRYFLNQANDLEKFYTKNESKMSLSFSGYIALYLSNTLAKFSKFSDMLEKYRLAKNSIITFENILDSKTWIRGISLKDAVKQNLLKAYAETFKIPYSELLLYIEDCTCLNIEPDINKFFVIENSYIINLTKPFCYASSEKTAEKKYRVTLNILISETMCISDDDEPRVNSAAELRINQEEYKKTKWFVAIKEDQKATKDDISYLFEDLCQNGYADQDLDVYNDLSDDEIDQLLSTINTAINRHPTYTRSSVEITIQGQ